MKTLYITRHGQTVLNVEKRVQGSFDSPLTPLGIEQAKQARAWFNSHHITFDKAYCSTQERACDTCDILHDGVYTRLKGLKEWHFGEFEGYPEAIMSKAHVAGEPSFENHLVQFGGESCQQVGERMVQTLTEIMENAEDNDTVLAVSHGGAMWAFALNAHLDELPQPPYSNCCIIKYMYHNGKFQFVEKINPLE